MGRTNPKIKRFGDDGMIKKDTKLFLNLCGILTSILAIMGIIISILLKNWVALIWQTVTIGWIINYFLK
jgi:hypothetical protein